MFVAADEKTIKNPALLFLPKKLCRRRNTVPHWGGVEL
jgi:hypothetical protein